MKKNIVRLEQFISFFAVPPDEYTNGVPMTRYSGNPDYVSIHLFEDRETFAFYPKMHYWRFEWIDKEQMFSVLSNEDKEKVIFTEWMCE
jgi:hypothetical protein